jgi:hypothetical protein
MLPSFFTAHVARFLATGRISNIASGERRLFLTELARLLSASGWINLSQLTAGPREIAWNYGFQFAGSWFWYQPTFDTAYEPLSPGYCLLAKIVLEACDAPDVQRVDLGLGAEGYKERFANHVRPTLHGTLTRSLFDHARVAARYSVADTIALSPPLDSSLRKARTRLTSAKEQGSSLLPLLGKAAARARALLRSRVEVVFYQWPLNTCRQEQIERTELQLVHMDLSLLAQAAMESGEDKETCRYLVRSARRFNDKRARGFVLLNLVGVPVHLCWVERFDGFSISELATRLKSEVPNADLIFDCWTPRVFRGRGYYAQAIARVAGLLVSEGREPWIFSAATNRASVQGIDRSGFERRYSLVRQATLGTRTVSKIDFVAPNGAKVPVAR